MCTITRERPKLQVATKDIEVYKIGKYIKKKWFKLFSKSYFESPIRNFKYKRGKIYKVKLRPFTRVVLSDKWSSGPGFYSYATKSFIPCCTSYIVAKFIIPKGSKYYLAEDIDNGWVYTSNQIKFIDII